MSEEFEVAFVCTGNRARSPLAEALYRAYSEGLNTVVTSYGTANVGAVPPLPQAVAAAARLGIDLSSHRARPLQRGSVASTDLVLGFEPFHVAVAVVDGGAPAAHTFLLAELVLLLDTSPIHDGDVPQAGMAVALADSKRIRSRPDETAVVLDPLGKADEVMFDTAQHIDELVGRLVHGLFGRATSLQTRKQETAE